jgi:transcriptional regulator with XRE-family HTH domain
MMLVVDGDGRTRMPDWRGTALEPIHVPDHVWYDHETELGDRDVGALFRLARRYAGASQHRIAAATGVPQSRVNRLINNRCGPVTRIDVLERIADGLNLPGRARGLMGLADRQAIASAAPGPLQEAGANRVLPRRAVHRLAVEPAASPAGIHRADDGDRTACHVPSEAIPGPQRWPHTVQGSETEGGDPTDRWQALHTFAGGVLGLALGADPEEESFERLHHALTAGCPDDAVVAHLESGTAALFTQEEQEPASAMAAQLARQVDLLARVIPAARAQDLQRRLIITAGETSALGRLGRLRPRPARPGSRLLVHRDRSGPQYRRRPPVGALPGLPVLPCR